MYAKGEWMDACTISYWGARNSLCMNDYDELSPSQDVLSSANVSSVADERIQNSKSMPNTGFVSRT